MIQYQILQIDIIRIVWQTVRRITDEILGVKGLGSWWDYSARTQIVKKALLVICTRVTSECTRFQPIRMRNFLIDVILKVSKFTVMIRTDAFCFGNFLQI